MMMKTDVTNTLSRTLHKVGFKLKKHSPEILLVAGVAGGVVSAVMACKATTKASAILEKTKKNVDAIHEVSENPDFADQYTPEDKQKDLTIVYAKSALDFAKLYGPSVVLGVASIGCILASHNIIHKRNLALAAAQVAEATAFKEYRGRVIERFGKELDKELKYNIRTKEIEEVTVDENGEATVVTKTVEVTDPNMESDYARFFDDGCIGWTKDPETNLIFLKHVQAQANDKLQRNGYLYLNDVYKMLGIPVTKAGQVVGWIYDEKDPIGDNYVDFGIYDLYNERKRAFVNGLERTILLDFNVDGNIWELMK